MSKSILIIDKPKSCADCRLKRGLFCGENGNSLYDYIHNDDSINDKPSWCKLKPMPSRWKSDYDTIATYEVTEKVVAMGWNACIEAILGEEDE